MKFRSHLRYKASGRGICSPNPPYVNIVCGRQAFGLKKVMRRYNII